MPFVEFTKLAEMQNIISRVRNICILAHVDHGKTTLADSLVASNGIISQRMAGKLRYLDNRPDEQERGITMKSSSISLFYQSISSGEQPEDYLINLIDSPGHVDFSSEVSTAVRLCDGAIIVVDVVEGVCPQTRACLQQTYQEHLKPVLLLNKIDRLILEKKMEPLDAYIHLTQLLEQVNAVMGNIFASDVLSKENLTNMNDYTSPLEDSDDSKLYFTPENQNVVFCSAIDGWAFSTQDFAKMYAKRLELKYEELEKCIWGDFYYNSKKKCCMPGAQEKAKKPIFVQCVLDNIWSLYEMIMIRKDKEKLPDIANKLNVKLTARDLRLNDPRTQLKTIFEQWLPIDRAVLEMIIKNVPQPNQLSDEKAERLLCPSNIDFNTYPLETQALKEDFKKCDPKSENVIAFVSKMISVHVSHLPQNKPKRLTEQEIQERRDIARQKILERKRLLEETSTNEINQITEGIKELTTQEATEVNGSEECVDEEKEDQVFIAFTRVFSGTLKKGMKLWVLSPKHDPRNNVINSPHVQEVCLGDLYLLMGGELEILEEVPAGNIVGIGGLENAIIKTATISSTIYCSPFSELTMIAKPILTVALEPVNPLDMPKLVKGLRLLNQADACVQVSVQETGEHVISTLGEVHLEKCVRDLEENYAKIKLNVSKPIVSFRETIVPEASIDMVNETIVKTSSDKDIKKKIISIQTSNKLSTIELIALPLPPDAVNVLENNANLVKILSSISKINKFPEKYLTHLNQLKSTLNQHLEAMNLDELPTSIETILTNKNLIERIWSIGSRKCGTNILLNLTDYKHSSAWKINFDEQDDVVSDFRRDFNSSFVNGFQLATLAGPLCEEPMQGVCFVVLKWEVNSTTADELNSKVFGPLSGQVMSAVKEGCRRAFQKQPQRLVSPMYSCNIIVNAEVLGKMYAVIGRRHGKVLSGDLTQGSGNFSVTAVLPVIESFNFAQEIRKQTSGLACPQLVFSHWEIIDIDPFWVPSTEEEYAHFGEKADSVNRAKLYMDSVRKRKGLHVEEKIVEHAEKQRTLSKNK